MVETEEPREARKEAPGTTQMRKGKQPEPLSLDVPAKPEIETEPTIEDGPKTLVQTKLPDSPPESPVKVIE